MSATASGPEGRTEGRTEDRSNVRRAERLLGCYPAAWRARYGDELVALLVADMDERPRSWRRTADVLAHGGLARLRVAGVLGRLADPVEQTRNSLATLGAAAATFFVFGTAMWSQVAVGWRWEPPSGPAITVAMVAMTVFTLAGAALLVLAAAPIGWAWMRAVTRAGQNLVGSALLTVGGASLLVAGCARFARRWPGTGGHPWAYHGIVPAGVSAFVWAATRGVSSYWVHPTALATFGPAEVAWMALSPVAIVCVIAGVSRAVRRLDLTPAVWRYEAALARAARIIMLAFLAGAASWVVADLPPGPTGIYRVGTIDVIGLAIMGLAWVVAHGAVRGLGGGALSLLPGPGRPGPTDRHGG